MQNTVQRVCGAATITVDGERLMHGVCYCANCKQRTGNVFGIATYFLRSRVVAQTGEMQKYAFHFAAQNHDQARYFCKSCGTTLYWTVSTLPDQIGIAGGCFVGENLPPPTYSLTHAKKAPWLQLPEPWQKWD